MKIFLSALEQKGKSTFNYINDNITSFKWNLMSYFYVRKTNKDIVNKIIEKSELILIDSGAHSFQKGVVVDWVEYTKEYAKWIKENDCDKIIGYFEMDVDKVIGYKKVLELREILESVTDKIIPVWHKNRGVEDFVKMCKKYNGKIVAITGFRNEDIKDEQYIKFLKVAKKYNCKVHCLGMTRKSILDKVPFDYTDSSSWSMQGAFGKVRDKKVSRNMTRGIGMAKSSYENYLEGMEMQEYYYKKWRFLHKD